MPRGIGGELSVQLPRAHASAVEHAPLANSIVVHTGKGAGQPQQQPLWLLWDEQQPVGGVGRRGARGRRWDCITGA